MGTDEKGRAGWDELSRYEAKHPWRADEAAKGERDIDAMREMTGEDITPLEKRWEGAWNTSRAVEDAVPQRIPLQAKLTKRCPAPTCRHILIQPDTKSVRMLIKMVATNYLPAMELGRRRHRHGEAVPAGLSEEEWEKRRKERRRARVTPSQEVDQDMDLPLRPGEVVSNDRSGNAQSADGPVLLPASIHEPTVRPHSDPTVGTPPKAFDRAEPPNSYPDCALHCRRTEGDVRVR